MSSIPNTSGLRRHNVGFTLPDLAVLLATLSLLGAVLGAMVVNARAKARREQCLGNVKEVTRAVLLYAEEHHKCLPQMDPSPPIGVWWMYKEMVKGYLGLTGPSSPRERQFACPDDRGYTDPGPFNKSARFAHGSYVFNGVALPGVPNLAGQTIDTILDPGKTLLVMEWTAHAPLSWHTSRTGRKNHPFYCDAENMVGFVDGRVKYIPIYYDGINPAYTRDPIAGYEYKFSGD